MPPKGQMPSPEHTEKVELILKKCVLPLMGPRTEKGKTSKRLESKCAGNQQPEPETQSETSQDGF